MAGGADVRDLCKAQPAEGLVTVCKVFAGFSRIVAGLRIKIERRPLLQNLIFEVDAIGEALCKQHDLSAPIRVAAKDRLGAFRALQSFDASGNSERGNSRRIRYHTNPQAIAR